MTTESTTRKLIAVVHADVKGYSRMMGEDDEYTVRTLASNREEMYRQVGLNRGQVVDTAGDGFLVEFSSVSNDAWIYVEGHWWNPTLFYVGGDPITALIQIVWLAAVLVFYFAAIKAAAKTDTNPALFGDN